MTESVLVEEGGWAGAWPDLLAFAGGLAMAWTLDWNTTDLVWSLWLSSLVVGYAMIAWSIFSPALLRLRKGAMGGANISVLGGLLVLAFFTFHFGMFHFIHSVFLGHFFPPDGAMQRGSLFGGLSRYVGVVKDYAWFLPVAFLAERRHFQLKPPSLEPAGLSLKTVDHTVGKGRQDFDGEMMAPYKNVVRMHLLIFFFAGAHALKLEHFAVYAVVYAVYFFPWRLLSSAARRS